MCVNVDSHICGCVWMWACMPMFIMHRCVCARACVHVCVGSSWMMEQPEDQLKVQENTAPAAAGLTRRVIGEVEGARAGPLLGHVMEAGSNVCRAERAASDMVSTVKRHPHHRRNYLQLVYLIQNEYTEYTENGNATKNLLKNRKKT